MRKLPCYMLPVILVTISCATKKVDPNRPLPPPKGYLNETLLKIAYGLGVLDLIETQPAVPDEIAVYKNLEYKKVDSLSLQLDIYKLKDAGTPAPVMIFIHGGAWRTGKRSDYLPYLIDYAKKGYVTATVSYRLVKQAPFPAAVQDVNCAVKWIAKHAEQYGMDRERIALIGGSAGAHLALMNGFGTNEERFNRDCEIHENPNIKAVIDLYGPADLTTPYATGTYQVRDFLDTAYELDPGRYIAASPKTYISAEDPPTLIFHGTIDSLVPIRQSDSLASWLAKAGVPHEYHRLKGWPHTMDLSVEVNEYCQFYIDRFLEKYL
ncbi:MAG: alpha/beta hydrolase [Cytophagales bacterium]|nr:alpha/beta hydrolase [Cytophagales bacterium]